jgi:hypothetical protein
MQTNKGINIDYGDVKLNEFFRTIDKEQQNEILKYNKQQIQKEILQNMLNPELNNYFDKLSDEDKATVEQYGIRDKYILLKQMIKYKDKGVEQQQQQEEDTYFGVEEEQRKQEEYIPHIAPDLQKVNINLLDNFIKKYYSIEPYYIKDIYHELEVRFGTIGGGKPFTRTDYDNVIGKLKSVGFHPQNNNGNHLLRIYYEFLDNVSGRFRVSDIRTEISGIYNIENYCKHDDIKQIYINSPNSVQFIKKRPALIKGVKVEPVNFYDFRFRVAYQIEEEAKYGIKNMAMNNWKNYKKEFRYLNRATFEHPDYPFLVDISIVKTGDKKARVYNIKDSNLFINKENYEIEIEIDNRRIGPLTEFNSPEKIVTSLRKVIKFVLSGIQGTNYPISYTEQEKIITNYKHLIDADSKRYLDNRAFIGPNSVTLQMTNIANIDENSTIPNIRSDFVVTDKADGERNLLLIAETGKMYFINTNMDIIFTGAFTKNRDLYNTLLDGEFIRNDKNRDLLSLYAVFDIYYYNKKDIRHLLFIDDNISETRYSLLHKVITNLDPVSVLLLNKPYGENTIKEGLKLSGIDNISAPITIRAKEFYPLGTQSIFEGCNYILTKEKDGLFVYNTDGLIFTHKKYGVGANTIGKAGPKTKITWAYSFKWKPPEFNTIDFLVSTEKDANYTGDLIKILYEEGKDTKLYTQWNEYKTLILRCGFDEKKDGFINPCQNIIEDNLPVYIDKYEENPTENTYLPQRFYPTDPYDPTAGLCKIMLTPGASGEKNMITEEGEVFQDNMIVEFRYDLDRQEGWRWIPLRVRYDKTARYLRGEREFGNAYRVANENWKSIHPTGRITKEMLMTGNGIPDIIVSEDKYYNTPAGKMQTEALKNFHNLYVKKMLILAVSAPDYSLIDYACGKAGDLPKWIYARLSFVFGIDYSKDNLENRIDGACVRYLQARRENRKMPYALFVNGNSSLNIRNGSAMMNEKAKQITKALFGHGNKDPEILGKGVARQYGKYEEGFHISSCQFALHYFFENPDTLKGFVTNLAQCTRLGGYFIATAYDGKLIFDLLKNTKTNESIQLNQSQKKIWEVVKEYGAEHFDNNSSCIGYRISVYQESINQFIPEYLVNFDYFSRVMEAYGFHLITKEEAVELKLPNGTGLFSELFADMKSRGTNLNKNYGKAPYMTEPEKKISFLNRYVVYKKHIQVNTDKVVIDLNDYIEQYDQDKAPLQEAEIPSEVLAEKERTEVAEPAKKIKKLGRRIKLVEYTNKDK